MRRAFHHTLLALLSGSTLALVPGAARAQEAADAATSADAATDDFGQDLVITARRREESAQTVPISVTAFSGDMLRAKTIVSTQDLTQVTPGLNVAPQGSRDTPSLVIRGQRRSVTGAGAPAVVTYFQDVPLPNEGSLLPTFDIASIQALKGPQGTLFGRNTTGGALLVYAQTPVYNTEGYIEGTYGRFNERKLEGALNLPIVADKVALRVAGQYWRRDGYTENLGVGRDLDDINVNSIRASLLLEPVDGLKNVTVFDHYRAREAGTATILHGVYPNPAVLGGGNARTAANAPYFDCGVRGCDIDIALADQQAMGVRKTNTSLAPISNRDIWGIANTTTLDVGAVTFKNIFGYRVAKLSTQRDGDGSPLTISDGIGRVDNSQISNELQMLGNLLDDRLDWIIGGFYLESRPGEVNGGTVLAPVLPGQSPVFQENYITTESKALFGQVGYDLSGLLDGLKFNAGFRYTWDKSSGCTVSRTLSAGFAGKENCASLGGRLGRESSSAPTWTLGFDYKLSNDVFLFVTHRRGYRSGGFNQSGLNAAFARYETYSPEKITDFEGGVKARWRLAPGARATLNFTAYTSDYSNIQRALTLGANFDGDNIASNDANSLIINAAKATISGFELDGSISVGGLTVSGFTAYTHAKYDQFDAVPVFVPLLGSNPVANKFSYTPEWTLGANVRYVHDLGRNVGELALNANYFFADKTWFVERPFDVYGIEEPYKVVNAKIELNKVAGSGADLAFFVRNLFDETFATAAGITTPAVTPTTKIYNEPRVYGVQLRFTFGK